MSYRYDVASMERLISADDNTCNKKPGNYPGIYYYENVNTTLVAFDADQS